MPLAPHVIARSPALFLIGCQELRAWRPEAELTRADDARLEVGMLPDEPAAKQSPNANGTEAFSARTGGNIYILT